jgi:amidohydrolase
MSLQTVISREISGAVITIGQIEAGTAPNIIPDQAILKGIIRTLSNEKREYIVRRVEEITKGLVRTMRGEVSIFIEESYPSLINNSKCVKLVRDAAQLILEKENILEQKKTKLGVESFACFAKEVDSVFYFLGVRNEKKGMIHPAHSTLFQIDEESIEIGIALQCQSAFNYLTK